MVQDDNGLDIFTVPLVFGFFRSHADPDPPVLAPSSPLTQEVHSRKIYSKAPLAEDQLIVFVTPSQVSDVQFPGGRSQFDRGHTTLFNEPYDEGIHVDQRVRLIFFFRFFALLGGLRRLTLRCR